MSVKKITSDYARLYYWFKGFRAALREILPRLTESDEDKELRRQISANLWKLEEILEKFLAAKIGKRIMYEIRNR